MDDFSTEVDPSHFNHGPTPRDDHPLSWPILVFIVAYAFLSIALSFFLQVTLLVYQGSLDYDPLSFWLRLGLPIADRVKMSRDQASRIIQAAWRKTDLTETVESVRREMRKTRGMWFVFCLWHTGRNLAIIFALLVIIFNNTIIMMSNSYDRFVELEIYLMVFTSTNLLFHEAIIFVIMTASRKISGIAVLAMINSWVMPLCGSYLMHKVRFDNVFEMFYADFVWVMIAEGLCIALQMVLIKAAGFHFKRIRCNCLHTYCIAITKCCRKCTCRKTDAEHEIVRYVGADENKMAVPLLIDFARV